MRNGNGDGGGRANREIHPLMVRGGDPLFLNGFKIGFSLSSSLLKPKKKYRQEPYFP
jgi:hypothetical protein